MALSAFTQSSNNLKEKNMSNTELIAGYFKAIQTGDMPTLGSLVAADVVWHQPGHNKFSGTHTGAEAVFGMIGAMMQDSAGSFKIVDVKDVMGNGSQVAATISFSAQRDGAQMALNGVDVFTVENGQITEVWLYSSDQDAEDAFWGNV
jgi:hypothetical protein